MYPVQIATFQFNKNDIKNLVIQTLNLSSCVPVGLRGEILIAVLFPGRFKAQYYIGEERTNR
jgi:hypothetical protein